MYSKKIIFAGIFLLILFIIIAGLFISRSYSKIVVSPLSGTGNINLTPTPTLDPTDKFSVLLLGYGGGKHQGGLLTDSMIAVIVDPKHKKLSLISIPRDLWIQIPFTNDIYKGYKINAAYAIGSDDRNYPNKPNEFKGEAGGGMLSKYAVESALGIPINFFVSLDFNGFIKSIDVLGGVEINVNQKFVDPFYPLEGKETDNCEKNEEEIEALTATMSGELLEQQFSCRYETLEFDPGIIHMDGNTALKYVRSRHSSTNGNDFGRSSRQRMLISAVLEKIISIGFIPKIIPFINSLTYNLRTDISLEDIKKIIDNNQKINEYEVNEIQITTDNILTEAKSSDGQYILTGGNGEFNWKDVHNYIKNQLNRTETAN